ncbi:unnamed protein product [Penicillium roqueforti FM164]|uniref:Genomic scaffold, ProqFM164S02 n=1 Tax=Penicillium roqueforti (strain FM164) TaxID=1365484 RepID=W6QK30_PENRF|nr:unnamed protein product [Penicillium roqueforti FM164]
MIFAMASIGAIYYDDELTAASLHRMSKANTIKYCLLLVMANGTKSGDFRTFQEAASLASLLIEIIVTSRKILCLEGALMQYFVTVTPRRIYSSKATNQCSDLSGHFERRKLPPYAPESDGGDVDLLRRWQK